MESFRQILVQLIKKEPLARGFFDGYPSDWNPGLHNLSKGQYTLLDCLYMTVITITTIGYGEIVDLSQNPVGRVFTMFIAFSGIGIATYVFSNVTALMV